MHEGHRRRLLQKLKNGDNLFEHELLEILLFNAYPRKNVNPVAHALLSRFAGIGEILQASPDELTTVEGVGENVAMYLNCIGQCLRRANDVRGFAVIRNASELIAFAKSRLGGRPHETLEFYFMDKSDTVRRVCTFTDNDPRRVNVRPEEIVRLISVCRPFGVYMAHNHTDCSCNPSEADDDITKKVQLICSMNNVRLYDHCIIGPDGEFSYFLSDRLDKIAEQFSASNFFKGGL